MSTDEHAANVIARELEELNAHRQELDRQVLEDARAKVLAMDLDDTFGIVLAGEYDAATGRGWHPGVIGIVASRIVEEFGRPAILIGLDGDDGKGSGRSISRFDLHQGIGRCKHLLKRFGGHYSAAGVTIARNQVAAFATAFNESARSVLTRDDLFPELRVDTEVSLADLTPSFESLMRHLEPCGMGNPAPMLMARGVRLAGPPRVVGASGLKLRVAVEPGRTLDAIGWSLGPRIGEIDVARPMDLAFRIERDEYQGVSRLQLRIADFRAA
jgi:single-stranded-DNA-specific exonuclease